MSSWYHHCELDVSTLNLLSKRQIASLEVLLCNRYSSSCNISGNTVFGNMYSLSIESMDLDRSGCRWAAAVIVRNAEALDYLSLGFASQIANDFAIKSRLRYDEMTAMFTADVGKLLSDCNLDPLIHLSLSSLCLCGLDFGSVIRGEMALDIDFNKLTWLRLESCPGLSQAFLLLTGQGDSSKLALPALEDLFIRLEDPDPSFSSNLEGFLTSIRGLTYLQVLVDKALGAQNLEPILKVHGRTLNTLIWDERARRRRHLDHSTSLLPNQIGNLRIVSQNCPSLKVLGIPLGWETIGSSEKFHKTVTNIFFQTIHTSDTDGL